MMPDSPPSDPEPRDRNWEWFRTHASPASADSVRTAGPGDLTVTEMPDGHREYCCIRDGRSFYLHSRRAPDAEAVRQADGLRLNPHQAGCIVLGVAGGYHLTELARRLPPDSLLIVIDRYPGRVAAALPYLDVAGLDRCRIRVAWIVNASVEAIRREFHHLFHRELNCDFGFFIQPGLWRMDERPWHELALALQQEIRLETSDRATRAASAEQWLANAVAGLPVTLRNPQIDRLAGCFSGGTVLVAAAGPTLTAALPMLRQWAGRCPLIAVGTALKPLLRAGLVPDLAVIIDGNPITVNQVPETGLDETFLASAYAVPPPVAEAFAGRLFSCSFSALRGFNQWLTAGGLRVPLVNVGGTVAITAIDVALLTGCRRVVLCGLDLAMAEDGATHADGSMYGNDKLPTEQLLRVPGNYAETVPTTPIFAGYIRQMNAYLSDMVRQRPGLVFYNATVGGAALESVTLVRPEQVDREMVGTTEFAARPILRRCHADGIAVLPSWSPDYFRQTETELLRIAELAENAAALLTGDSGPAAAETLAATEQQLRQFRTRSLLNAALEAAMLKLTGNRQTDPNAAMADFYRTTATAARRLEWVLSEAVHRLFPGLRS